MAKCISQILESYLPGLIFCSYGQLDSSEKAVSWRDSQTTHGGTGKKYGPCTQVGHPNLAHICIRTSRTPQLCPYLYICINSLHRCEYLNICFLLFTIFTITIFVPLEYICFLLLPFCKYLLPLQLFVAFLKIFLVCL